MAAGNGLAAFKKRLARVPESIRKTSSVAIATNAAEWVSTAKSFAPSDPVDGTFLRESIRHYQTETGGQVVRAGGETTTKPTPAGPYDYAFAQEFGTAEMPASPFFWPSYRLLKKRMVGRRRRAMNKAFKEFNNG